MKKLSQKPSKRVDKNQDTESQEAAAPKKEYGVAVTLAINAAKALLLLVVVVFLVNILLGILTRHGSNRDVPELVGCTYADAEQMLKKERLELAISDTLFVPIYQGGVILEQRPSAGEGKVKAGRKIYVTINADHQRSVKVPYVTGLSLRQAVGDIVSVGLEVEELIYRRDLANKYILEERVGEVGIEEDTNMEAIMGSGVTLVVGINGNSSELVPNVLGKNLHDAKATLWSAGFNLGEVTYDEEMSLLDKTDAIVYKQSPGARVGGRLGGKVSLELTLDQEKIKR